MTHTLELRVRIVCKVDEKIAAVVARDPNLMSLNIPLTQIGLIQGTTPVDAKFLEYETMMTETIE